MNTPVDTPLNIIKPEMFFSLTEHCYAEKFAANTL